MPINPASRSRNPPPAKVFVARCDAPPVCPAYLPAKRRRLSEGIMPVHSGCDEGGMRRIANQPDAQPLVLAALPVGSTNPFETSFSSMSMQNRRPAISAFLANPSCTLSRPLAL